MDIEIKTVPSTTFFVAHTNLKINQIPEYAEKTSSVLWQKAESIGLEMIGSVNFVYFNSTGDPEKEITLEISIPVKEIKDYEGEFKYRESGEFKCASIDYKGSMKGIGEAWENLYNETVKSGYKVINECREIYKEWDSFDSDKNVTELQMGIE